MKRKKKVVILSHGLESNYGGVLQAYALQKVISKRGYEVVTDRYSCKNYEKTWKSYFTWLYYPFLELLGKKPLTKKLNAYLNRNIQSFIKANIDTVDFFKGKKCPSNNEIGKYDIFIVGSDQIWRKKYMRVESYFLDFLNGRRDIKRIAYAGSFGVDNLKEWNDTEIESCKELTKLFDAISVREDSGIGIFRDSFNCNVVKVLDPTMLLTSDHYMKLDGMEDMNRRNSLLFCYILDPFPEKEDVVNQIREHFEINETKIIALREYDRNCKDVEEYVRPSIIEWLSGFRDANFVFTDSFHGVVFSILFNKQFVCYENPDRGNTRIVSLLNTFGIGDRLISNLQGFQKVKDEVIDYNKINKILDAQRELSYGFLFKALG